MFTGVPTGLGFVKRGSAPLGEHGVIPEMGFGQGWAVASPCRWVRRRGARWIRSGKVGGCAHRHQDAV